MSKGKVISMDGNSAAAYVGHAMSEVIAIYPITPSSPMGEIADELSSKGQENIFGVIPRVAEMQAEGGAAGAVHGSCSAGCLTTTFTASQGLLLMIPSLYKLAGELLPCTLHVAARSISVQALSIFGDHSDVMACRQCGVGLTASSNPQEAMDMAAISTATSIKAKLPIIHFFDGFRTSHEIKKVEQIPFEDLKELVDEEAVNDFRNRALNPDKPFLKGTAQNPDIYFQGREIQNKYYNRISDIFTEVAEKFEKLSGRKYRPFDYVGDKNAETVFVAMGSGVDVIEETINYLTKSENKLVGAIKVRLYRPFDMKRFIKALPETVKNIIVLDRTKEPGAVGEPLYLDVVAAIEEAVRKEMITKRPLIVGGRYGLSSKEFTPSMINAALEHVEQAKSPKDIIHGFTLGIEDDVTKLSIPVKRHILAADPSTKSLLFWGLGSDGTVGANKNSIKVIGDNTDKYVQGYFVYDSKKSGGTTISHLRFSDKRILSNYLVEKADFVAIHNKEFLNKYDMIDNVKEGTPILLNTDVEPEKAFATFKKSDQQKIIDNKLKLFVIDAHKVVDSIGLTGRINTTMQAAFFKIANVIPEDVYKPAIEKAITKTYLKKGQEIVDKNIKAFSMGLNSFIEVKVPNKIIDGAVDPEFHIELSEEHKNEHDSSVIKNVIMPIMKLQGDKIPVSQIPEDSSFPSGTTKYEKRNVGTHLPNWKSENCIECGLCSFVCPHATIRPKVNKKADIKLSDTEYKTIPVIGLKDSTPDDRWRIQVYPDDCTGCGVCVSMCPGKKGNKALELVPKKDVYDSLKKSYAEFERLPETDEKYLGLESPKKSQLIQPLFEFSGACAGCGETPYIKLMTQVCGERMIQANATGCSSIYGGTAPIVPYCTNKNGEGPAWASSLFEDNAEYGFGMHLAKEKLTDFAFQLLEKAKNNNETPKEVLAELNKIRPVSEQVDEDIYKTAKNAVRKLKTLLKDSKKGTDLYELNKLLSYLTEKIVWIVGGDGWAYDIGYGGLDHVVASGENVNILVLDTEVYSNTGGQCSKATPLSGIAKFAAGGKEQGKKDLGLMCMSYGNVYVASINFGANPAQTLKAIREAVKYPGVSIIIAYSHCIAHGINMGKGPDIAKLITKCGYWPLYTYDPRKLVEKKNPLKVEYSEPTVNFDEFAALEGRFKRLKNEKPETAKRLFAAQENFLKNKYRYYKKLEEIDYKEFSVVNTNENEA